MSASATKHLLFLTSENGEPIWIRADVFANAKEGLAAYNNEYGADWSLTTPLTGEVHMKHAPTGDDPDWHEQVDAAGADTALYWRFDV